MSLQSPNSDRRLGELIATRDEKGALWVRVVWHNRSKPRISQAPPYLKTDLKAGLKPQRPKAVHPLPQRTASLLMGLSQRMAGSWYRVKVSQTLPIFSVHLTFHGRIYTPKMFSTSGPEGCQSFAN